MGIVEEWAGWWRSNFSHSHLSLAHRPTHPSLFLALSCLRTTLATNLPPTHSFSPTNISPSNLLPPYYHSHQPTSFFLNHFVSLPLTFPTHQNSPHPPTLTLAPIHSHVYSQTHPPFISSPIHSLICPVLLLSSLTTHTVLSQLFPHTSNS